MRAVSKLALLTFWVAMFLFGSSFAAFADTGCSEKDPLITIFPTSITSPAGQVVAFTVEVKNQDTENCPIKPFTVNGTSSNLSVSLDPSSFTLAPGEAKTSLMKVVVPSDAATKDYDIVVIASDVNFTSSQTTTVMVRTGVEDCQARLGNLRFKEKTATNFGTTFFRHDEVSAIVDLSLLGKLVTNVTLQLFVNGNLFDSFETFASGNSVNTVKFSNSMRMENFVSSVSVRVKAVPFCNPAKGDETSGSISISQADEKVDVSVVLGTPNNTVLGDTILSRVFLKNQGKKNTTVNVDAFLCDANDVCKSELVCDNSIVFIETDDTLGIDCRVNATATGTFRVKGIATFGEDRISKISKEFLVTSAQGQVAAPTAASAPKEGKINEISYACSGKIRQAVYTTTEGTKTSDIEFCPNGCLDGSCVVFKPVTKGIQTPPGNLLNDIVGATQPVFSQPQENTLAASFNNFVEWLKNLLFPKPS